MAAQSAQDALRELANLLQSMQSLKAPGANKSKIEAITKICTAKENAQVWSGAETCAFNPPSFLPEILTLQLPQRQVAIVDTILDAFNRSSNTHKLGVMYIIDTVTRQWIAGGSEWAAGVKKITSVLQHHMADMIQTSPEDQKVCRPLQIAKLRERVVFDTSRTRRRSPTTSHNRKQHLWNTLRRPSLTHSHRIKYRSSSTFGSLAILFHLPNSANSSNN